MVVFVARLAASSLIFLSATPFSNRALCWLTLLFAGFLLWRHSVDMGMLVMTGKKGSEGV